MPMNETTVLKLNESLGPANIDETAANAAAFAPGVSLNAGFVHRSGTKEHDQLSAYLQAMPSAVKEVIRATIYQALTSDPAVPVIVTFQPAYYFNVSVSQLPATTVREGVITLALEGPLPGDRNSVIWSYPMSPGPGAARKSSKMGAPKPASRKPSSRSKKSS